MTQNMTVTDESGYGMAELFARFTALGLETKTFEHEPVFTVEQGLHLHDVIPGGHCRNLFLKDKKGTQWLFSAVESTKIDLKLAGNLVGANGRLSFGSEDRLWNALKVRPGSVTPFALINDADTLVRPVLDHHLFDHEWVNFHPMRNDRSTMIRPKDLVTFIESCGCKPQIVDFSGLGY